MGRNELLVLLWQDGPVQAGIKVVDGVVSVVEGQVVEQGIREVARKIVLGRNVAAVMLEHVERQDAVLCVELWDQREPDPATPIQQDQHCHCAEYDDLLKPPLLGDRPILTSLCGKIKLLIIASLQYDDPKEQQAIEEIPLVVNLCGAH